MESQSHKLHLPAKIPWVTIFIALFAVTVAIAGSYWNSHTAGDTRFQEETRLGYKELSKEVQSNGKALARIEAILGK